MTEMVAHRNLVALTPQDMPGAQAEIATWCQQKIVALGAELREARINLRQAKKMKWKHQGWVSVVRRTIGRMLYYTKIRAAVRAGFLVVPNFPCEIMAVRVEEGSRPRWKTGTYPTEINEVKPELMLPPGEGVYVDEMIPTEDISFTTHPTPQHPQGTLVRIHKRLRDYDHNPDFPVVAVRPEIIAALDHAQQQKIFDRIGVAFGGQATMSRNRRKSDPIVLGQILCPWVKFPEEHMVTFFVAWWLDTRSLG